jgi:hypothetical protein
LLLNTKMLSLPANVDIANVKDDSSSSSSSSSSIYPCSMMITGGSGLVGSAIKNVIEKNEFLKNFTNDKNIIYHSGRQQCKNFLLLLLFFS